jgi:uncharacterized protein (DUF2252 family)
MATLTIPQRIEAFNRGREPERLALKYQAMASSAFAFLRGTCHLFYADLPDLALFRKPPAAWICGDLHLENFGTYKGENRLVYFDLNDFDEAALAPCTLELVRAVTSILVASRQFGIPHQTGLALCRAYLDAYREGLAGGKPRWIDRDAAQGLVARLFDGLRQRKRKEYIASRTELRKGKRTLDTAGRRALPATEAQRDKVFAFMEAFAATQPDPAFYRAIDIARRIAGTGSLGVERYVILIHGKGGPEGHYLLDLKQALPSALEPRLALAQPGWRTEAERVVGVQSRVQAVAPAFLHAVTIGHDSYVLKGLQPTEDRASLADARGDVRLLECLVRDYGHLTAWDQLRASGRQGSAIADELVAFGAESGWEAELVSVALECAETNGRAWQEFARRLP